MHVRLNAPTLPSCVQPQVEKKPKYTVRPATLLKSKILQEEERKAEEEAASAAGVSKLTVHRFLSVFDVHKIYNF